MTDLTRSCLHSYFEGTIYKLKEFVDSYGEHSLKELNATSYDHGP